MQDGGEPLVERASRDGHERAGGGEADDEKQRQQAAAAAVGAEEHDHADERPGAEDRDLTEAHPEQEAAPVARAEVIADVRAHAGLPSCCWGGGAGTVVRAGDGGPGVGCLRATAGIRGEGVLWRGG